MDTYKLPGEIHYEGLLLGKTFPKANLDRMREMVVVNGDILLSSFPKTGTTWVGEIVYQITQNCDIPEAQPYKRVVFPESCYPPADDFYTDTTRKPAIVKTHLPASHLGKILAQRRAKVIVTIRNLKDTLVSLYHFTRTNANMGNFPGSWDDFFEMYKAGETQHGLISTWYSSWVPLLGTSNVLLVKYEDIHEDPRGAVKKLSNFLGMPISDDKVETVVSNTSFAAMRENTAVNHATLKHIDTKKTPFIRKGIVGDWKNYFSPEQSRYIEEEYLTYFEGRGVTLRFEL